MDTRIRVLLVEDDARLAAFTCEFLEHYSIAVTAVSDGQVALQTALAQAFDAIVLDLMLPGMDGFALCQRIREQSAVPILMVTARNTEHDRVLGLDLGADDYIAKPYSVRELVSRIHAVVRRTRGKVGPNAREIRVGPLTLQLDAMSASLRGVPLSLTTYEFAILRVLAERRNQVTSREQILDLAKGSAEDSFDRSIDVRISRLRQKLGEDSRHPNLLRTVRGAGYLLSESELP